MIISGGKNNYPDNEFNYWEWSAPVLQTHDEIFAKIKELKLQGRVIKGFYTVGMGYNWTDYGIEEAVYHSLGEMIKSGRISENASFPFLPQGVYVNRFAELDEPFLIEFEDGDILGIDYSEGSSVRMELNTIPKDIKFGTNRRTFHPDVLFDTLIGRKIRSIEVTTSTELDNFTGSHGLSIGEQDAYITKVSIVCEKAGERTCEKLQFSSYYDYGTVAACDRFGEVLKIHAPDIRDVVSGFIGEGILENN